MALTQSPHWQWPQGRLAAGRVFNIMDGYLSG